MRRIVLAATVPLLLSIGVAAWLLLDADDRLPGELATHWDGSGDPNGFSSLSSFLWVTTGIGVVAWAVATGLAVSIGPRLPAFGNLVTWLPGAVAGFTAAILASTLRANLDVVDAADATLSPVWINAPLLGLMVGGGIGALIGRASGEPPSNAAGTTSPAGEVLAVSVSWRGAWWLIGGLGVAFLAIAVVTKLVLPLLLLPLLVGLVHYDLTVGPAGVAISGGLFGWPSTTIGLDEIEAATTSEVRAFREWGGWGLRMRLDGSQGLITRSGPALDLRLADGKRFVATVDEPAEAATLLASHLEAAR